MSLLFQPFDLKTITLANRIVMAPMTRSRAVNEIPDELTALYYQQRASAGLIISEGIPISQQARGYLYTPGIYTKEQLHGWQKVTNAVHAQKGHIYAQLWHVGRVSHNSLQPDKQTPVGPTSKSAKNSYAYAIGDDGQPGRVLCSQPRALTIEQIHHITRDYVLAAQAAISAGFDGVEIHAANGYLFEQFINGSVNDRNDQYGGTIANRIRFLLDTLDAVSAAIGHDKVGVRISPFGRLFDCQPFPDEAETWEVVAKSLNQRDLAYVHLSDQLTIGAEKMPVDFAIKFRSAYTGTLIAAGGFTKETGEESLSAGVLDLIAYGRPFITNPDLVERMQNNWSIVPADKSNFYGITGATGYTDFPTWKEQNGGKYNG